LDTYHLKKGSEDPWLLFGAKRGPWAKKVRKTQHHTKLCKRCNYINWFSH